MTTAKISKKSNGIILRLQRYRKETKTALIEEALDQFERQTLIEEINQSFKELKKDRQAWQEMLRERQELEQTIGDGLDDE